jgi:hypothetical protein
MQAMQVVLEIGEYVCSSLIGTNNETICALSDFNGNQSMPPVNITIDFGDGSGEQVGQKICLYSINDIIFS